MNKRGLDWGSFWPVFVIGGIMLMVSIAAGLWSENGFFREIVPDLSLTEALNQEQVSFGDAWRQPSFSYFDFIFGKVPQYLIDWTNPVSASIIIIGIWFLFFLIFGDIVNLFGGFQKGTSWLIAGILTIIVSNLKLVVMVSILALTVTSALGAFSVIASIMLIFFLFLAFHFGFGEFGRGIRKQIILRKAEESALRAEAGAKEAGAGLKVLKKITEQAGS